MPYSYLKDLFEAKKFKLPYLEADINKTILFFYDKKMSEYIDEIKQISDSGLKKYDKKQFVERVELIVKQIKTTLDLYFQGLPFRAYEVFKS